jgi:hypothetical protein
MPDLKNKLDKLLSDAADCQMIGSLAADPNTRADYRRRAEEFRALAEQLRSQLIERPRSDSEFLLQQALRCRRLAETLADAALKTDVLDLAAELERTAKRVRGDH